MGDPGVEGRQVQNVLPGGHHLAADHLVGRRPAAGRDKSISHYRLLDGARDARRAATLLRPRRLELARLESALLRAGPRVIVAGGDLVVLVNVGLLPRILWERSRKPRGQSRRHEARGIGRAGSPRK